MGKWFIFAMNMGTLTYPNDRVLVGKLPQGQIDKLEAIGFVWDVLKEKWNQIYAELVDFHNTNGHVNVPQRFGKLGAWCGTQRVFFKQGKLPQDRIDKLEAIGFVFGHK